MAWPAGSGAGITRRATYVALDRSVALKLTAPTLGRLAVQYARITGAAVVAVDVNQARLETARGSARSTS